MGRLESLELAKEFLLPGRARREAIPPLDGAWAPNDRIRLECEVMAELHEPEDVLVGDDDSLIATCGTSLYHVDPVSSQCDLVAELGGPTGALARHPDGGVLVCVGDLGLVRITSDGASELVVGSADGVPLRCPTAVAVADDGTVYITEGSTKYGSGDWVWDLMERNNFGRIVRHDPESGRTDVIADGLRYPNGICPATDGSLLVTEAWSHSLLRLHPDDRNIYQAVKTGMAGYPARINAAGDGTYWLSIFALRTQLVDFVLTQSQLRHEMMRTIEPDYWVRPALRAINSGLVPLQGGQIKKLGIVKPWAPARSYGLVVRIDDDGHALESLHSRAGETRHGIVSTRQHGTSVFIVSKGGDVVLRTQVRES